jgi:hypothetical protein
VSVGKRRLTLMLPLVLALPAVVVLGGVRVQASASAVGGSTRAVTWLAAGDSYASGAGLPKTTSPCAQGTGTNGDSSTWALVGAQELRTSGFTFAGGSPDLVACTGAISDEFFNSHSGLVDQIPKLSSPHGPQWTPKMKRFDLITFSFGGDDIGFPSIIQHCVTSQGCPPDQAVRAKIAALGSTGVYKGSLHIPSYPTFLRHVAEDAVVKGGNVVVMGYPELVEDPTLWAPGRTTCAGLSPSVVDTLRGWAGDLNATIGYAVAQANKAAPNGVHFTFIDTVTGQPQSASAIGADDPNLFEPASGSRHELCSTAQPWLNGLELAHLLSRSFHPNQDGENAMGNLAAEVISHLTWPWSTPHRAPRLAVATQSGMEIWSAKTGAVAAGPVLSSPLEIYNANWSADGDYLTWEQNLLPSQDESTTELVEYNTLTGKTQTWPTGDDGDYSGFVPGPDGVVAADLGTTQLTVFNLDGSSGTINLALPAISALTADGEGFVSLATNSTSFDPSATASPVALVSLAGTVAQTPAALPVISNPNSNPYEEMAASVDGKDLAVEQGDHTDVCGVGPSSVIFTADTVTGKVTSSGPPAPSDGSVLRVYSMAWSPSGVLDVTMYDCTDSTSNAIPTELWEHVGGTWSQVASNLLYAARGPGEVLATVSGDLTEQGQDGPYTVNAGPQKLVIGDAPITLSSPAEAIVWAP